MCVEDVLLRCPVCGYEWVEECPVEEDEVEVLDDLCPRCGAQGEPAD